MFLGFTNKYDFGTLFGKVVVCLSGFNIFRIESTVGENCLLLIIILPLPRTYFILNFQSSMLLPINYPSLL